MKNLIRLIFGSTLFFLCVFRPIEADLLASVARHIPLSNADKAFLYYQSTQFSECNGNILNSLGDAYISDRNPAMALMAYGKGIECSPGNSLMRFKFGEALLMMGFIEGKLHIDDALKLESNNPVYRSEVERLTKLQQPSQLPAH